MKLGGVKTGRGSKNISLGQKTIRELKQGIEQPNPKIAQPSNTEKTKQEREDELL